MKKYDLLVMGGGFAGVAAALSAARAGARVIIVDKGNSFGGAAVNCLVNPFMPYWSTINGERVELSQGIFREIRDELIARGAMYGESFLEEELKLILNEKLIETGVDILFHANLFDAVREGSTIMSVKLATVGGVIELCADYFIDATGDAQLSYLTGVPTVLGREGDHLCQPMTLCFRVGNVDVDRFYASRPRLKEIHAAALESGELINPRENILVFKTPIKNVLHFNTTRVIKKNPTDPFAVTEAEILARKQVYEIYEFMKKHADGLEDSYLISTAAEIGVRESRMIVGDYVLTEQDCLALTKFRDGIAACNYDIDIHNPEGTGTSHHYFGKGEYFTIPYRSLIPQGVDNMLVAGRCISSDHGAQASYRVMNIVCCLGEAAGLAAAMAAKDGIGVREVNTKTLRAALVKNGAFIEHDFKE